MFSILELLHYGDETKLNHRIRDRTLHVNECVFHQDDSDQTLLFPIASCGAACMETKLLSTYAKTQLPGGIYWDPSPEVSDILKDVEPSNDISESVLDLNDYLNTAIPNLDQRARSNLVEMKKNKTISWLDELPAPDQENVLATAVQNRPVVAYENKVSDK